LVIKRDNGEKFFIDKVNFKNQIYDIDGLIDVVIRIENNKIKKIIENQENDQEFIKLKINNKFLEKKLAESQNLINTHCGKWNRSDFCNKAMDDIEKDKELLDIGEAKLENIKMVHDLLIRNERENKETFINQIIKDDYADIHFSKITYNYTQFDKEKNKSVISAKSIICFNPVLKKKYINLWREYGRIEEMKLELIDKKVCEYFAKF
tara:strand:+ start:433 stop:1056 length:624 start_codon:yes stop_codon:yes gene_type:complete